MVAIWCSVVLMAAVNTVGPAVEARTLDGSVVSGSLVELGAEQVVLETTSGRVPLELRRLAGVVPKGDGPRIGPAPTTWVDLVDGSSLTASEYTVRDGRARIVLVGGAVLEAATSEVASVRFEAPTETFAAEWARVVDGEAKSDRLVVSKDQTLDEHRGVLGDISTTTVEFRLEGDVLPVKRSKVYGLVYYHPQGRQLPEAICRLTDGSGSSWAVRSIKLDGEKLAWTTPAGLELSQPVSAIARIDFSVGKIVYLSDLEPESVRFTPYFGGGQPLASRGELYAFRKDVGLESKPLSLDGKTYTKGLAVHSRTELVYRLPGAFRWFEAEAGIDDGVRPRGNVRLVIRGDKGVLLDTTVAGTSKSQPLKVDLQGVQRLTIEVDFGEDMDVGDHLDLANARMVK